MITGPRATVRRARELRSEMSVPERILWQALRRRPEGFKFRRQHPGGRFILDFYCAAARLAIEIDGWSHDCAETIARDRSKSAFLRSQGVATTRIPAALVLEDTEAVVTRIVEICGERAAVGRSRATCPSTTCGGPPPRAGEASATASPTCGGPPPRTGEASEAASTACGGSPPRTGEAGATASPTGGGGPAKPVEGHGP